MLQRFKLLIGDKSYRLLELLLYRILVSIIAIYTTYSTITKFGYRANVIDIGMMVLILIIMIRAWSLRRDEE